MKITRTVKKILDNYESDCPGTKANLARILMHGRLGGSGKMVILPVDQGFEHGPDRSFAPNPDAYDPHYHYQLAIDAGLNAYAAPLGPLEAGADTFAGAIPTILKLNSANSLSTNKDQAVTASVNDALRLGCSAIGFTIYPGSEDQYEMMEEIRDLAEEAKSVGLAVVMWSYPRGGKLDKAGETALDVCAYAAHMAALLGAHIIKVKPPTQRAVAARGQGRLREGQHRHLDARPRASSTSCRRPSTAGASSCSRAARPRTSKACSPRSAACATAAPTARSSAATPSSARATRRSTCSTRSSASIRARCKKTSKYGPRRSVG